MVPVIIEIRGRFLFVGVYLVAFDFAVGIGVSCDLLLFDEAAFISDPDHVMYAILPVYLSGNNTQIIFLSTPRGYDNYLYGIYTKACNGENSFIATRMNADDLPHRAEQIKLWTGVKDALFYEREIEGRFYGYGK